MAMKRINVLDVYISGLRVGELHHLQGGKLSFSYDDRWMNGQVAIPLSLSMPTIRLDANYRRQTAWTCSILSRSNAWALLFC